MSDPHEDLPHWIVFRMLNGTVFISKEPMKIVRSLIIPVEVYTGRVEMCFMELADDRCQDLYVNGVHVHYMRYFEIHPPTFEGATVH